MSDKDFAITKRIDKGWWIVACAQCGTEKTCFSFASAAAFLFRHLRCDRAEEGSAP